MRTFCFLGLILSGVCAEFSEELGDTVEAQTCHDENPLGDATSLLQRSNLQVIERGQDEITALALLESGATTRSCLHDHAITEAEDCTLSTWSAWTDCSKSCGRGTRTRSREVISAGGKCGCLKEGETCNAGDCEDPIDPNNLKFKVCGKVKNAADNSLVPDASLKILELETTSDEEGEFCFKEVPQGETTLIATKDGWVDVKMDLTIDGNMQILVWMSKIQPPKDWRIIMQWGKAPLDLDARTEFGVLSQPKECAVSYAKRSETCSQNGIAATLDLDHCFYSDERDNNGKKKHSCVVDKPLPGGPSDDPKPETTTLTNVDPEKCGDDCTIVFHVSNYMGSCLYASQKYNQNYCGKNAPNEDTGTLNDSQAEVRVIHGEKEVAFFQIAKNEGYRNWDGQEYEEWWVFSIDVKTSKVTPCTSATGTCV